MNGREFEKTKETKQKTVIQIPFNKSKSEKDEFDLFNKNFDNTKAKFERFFRRNRELIKAGAIFSVLLVTTGMYVQYKFIPYARAGYTYVEIKSDSEIRELDKKLEDDQSKFIRTIVNGGLRDFKNKEELYKRMANRALQNQKYYDNNVSFYSEIISEYRNIIIEQNLDIQQNDYRPIKIFDKLYEVYYSTEKVESSLSEINGQQKDIVKWEMDFVKNVLINEGMMNYTVGAQTAARKLFGEVILSESRKGSSVSKIDKEVANAYLTIIKNSYREILQDNNTNYRTFKYDKVKKLLDIQ